MKNTVSLFLCLVLALSLFSGCEQNSSEPKETRAFTDSAGREVQIPVEIETIVPSGSYAQMILYTLCPDRLLGLSDAITKIQKQYIEEEYWDLPVFGKLYGSAGTFNLEEIVKAQPDIIIDMGEAKVGIGTDMDTVQAQTGIPVIFIEATLETMADAYDTLGEILGIDASAHSAYIREVMDFAEEVRNQIPEDERPRVMYSQGEYGNEVNGKGSAHSEILDYVGVINAADMQSILSSGGDEVSMEQIILWDPEVVILAPDSNYREIYDDPMWTQVTAVKNGDVYEVPVGPYNWLDRPPSVQRILGILWLGNIVYPQYYDFDIAEKTREFYRLFLHYELSDDEIYDLLKNSTYK